MRKIYNLMFLVLICSLLLLVGCDSGSNQYSTSKNSHEESTYKDSNAQRYHDNPDDYKYQKPTKANPDRWDEPGYEPNDADMREISERYSRGDSKKADELEEALHAFYGK